MPRPNDPYSRPINATRPEGQMLQGEFYGEHASDKALHQATGGRQVHQVRPMPSVVPDWPDAHPEPKPKRKRATPSQETATPNPDVTSPSDEQSVITEDDLFG